METIKDILKTYKWLIMLGVFLLMFLLFIFFAFTRTSEVSITTNITPTPNLSEFQTIQPQISPSTHEGLEDNPETLSGFQSKQLLGNGNIAYTLDSGNPGRPNVTIVSPNGDMLFSRTLSTKDAPFAGVSLFTETYGQPGRTIKGSKFYGPQAVVYIYPMLGIAFISNPETDETFEQQQFPPMSIDDYLKNYGSDISQFPN